jgi:hypothetical protein
MGLLVISAARGPSSQTVYGGSPPARGPFGLMLEPSERASVACTQPARYVGESCGPVSVLWCPKPFPSLSVMIPAAKPNFYSSVHPALNSIHLSHLIYEDISSSVIFSFHRYTKRLTSGHLKPDIKSFGLSGACYHARFIRYFVHTSTLFLLIRALKWLFELELGWQELRGCLVVRHN